MTNQWLTATETTVGKTKHLLANLSIRVRTDQYNFFKTLMHPDATTTILDIGATSDETLKDSNMFEKLYPFPDKLTAATIEDEKKLQKLYPKIHTKKINPGEILPYKNKSFDVVVSWATLEHVGSYTNQKFFIDELLRVGKNIYLTTPYRGCIYEPHTGFFFLHWLPLHVFRWICAKTGQHFWTTEANLNPLYVRDVARIIEGSNIKIKVYRMFGFLPSHIVLYT
jgi:hypothetical protein